MANVRYLCWCGERYIVVVQEEDDMIENDKVSHDVSPVNHIHADEITFKPFLKSQDGLSFFPGL